MHYRTQWLSFLVFAYPASIFDVSTAIASKVLTATRWSSFQLRNRAGGRRTGSEASLLGSGHPFVAGNLTNDRTLGGIADRVFWNALEGHTPPTAAEKLSNWQLRTE